MKNLIRLILIAAVVSLTALPAMAGGRHKGGGHGDRTSVRVTKTVEKHRYVEPRRERRRNGGGHIGRTSVRTAMTVQKHRYAEPRRKWRHNRSYRDRGRARHARAYRRHPGHRQHWIGDGHGHRGHRSRVVFNFGYVAPAPTYYAAPLPAYYVAPLPAYVIVDRLHRQSYYNVGPAYLDRGHYYLRAHDPYGARVKLVIHAGSGSIVARYYLR